MISQGYRSVFNGVEDYDLWFRLMELGKFFNLPEILVKRRWHKDVITRKKHLNIELKAILIRMMHLL